VTRFIRRCGLFLALFGCLLVASPARAQDDDKARALRRHYLNGVKAFDNERFAEAAEQFEAVLKLSPSHADALALRDLATVQFYIKVMNRGTPKMRENILQLLELAAEAEKARFTDVEQIKKRIARLAGTFEERLRIYVDLQRAGRYAVPPLVQRLNDVEAKDYEMFRVQATICLVRIGEEAVLPLCTALRADAESVRQDICFVLGQIGDPRSVPYLLQAATADSSTAVQHVAAAALARIRAYAEVPDEPAHVGLFRYARLYYYDDPSVYRPSKYGHTLWTWSAGEQRLIMQVVPGFLYNVNMARQVAARALLAAPDYEPVLPLLISAYEKETVLIEDQLAYSKRNKAARLSELEERQLRERLAKARRVLMTLRSAGERHFYRALALQLHDKDAETAIRTIRDLAEVADPALNTYPELAALSEPVRPAVITIRMPLDEVPDVVRTETDTASKARKPRVSVASLFQTKVASELKRVKAAEPRRAATVKRATPAERATLNYVIAMARRKARRTSDEIEEKKPEDLPEALATTANPLLRALRNPIKTVRYEAAAAIVRIRPTGEFGAARSTVKVIGHALTERGVSAALIVSNNNQAVNRLRQIVRKAGHIPYSASSVDTAVSAARALPPKDAIIVQDTLGDAIAALKADPVIGAVPIIVFTRDRDTKVAEQAYGAQAVAVISLRDRSDNVSRTVVDTIAAGHVAQQATRLSGHYGRLGAEALAAIPAAGSPLSRHLATIKPELIAALESDDRAVRISVIGGLGKAKVMSLLPRLTDMAQADDRAAEERLACIGAVADMMEPGKPTPPDVVKLIKAVHADEDDEFRAKAVRRLRGTAIPAAEIERVVSDQESSAATAGAGAEAPEGEAKPEDEVKVEDKPEDKPEDKVEEEPAEKPAEKPAAKAEDEVKIEF